MAIALKLSKSDVAVPWGFRLVGGADFDQPVVVVKVNENSLAESAGLEVGDIIVRVNDTPTAGLTHNEVHDLLLSSGLELELGIRRGDFSPRIITDEDYSIEESNIIQKAIEEEIINEAIVRLNNLKNSIDFSEQQTNSSIIEDLTGQEEIVNPVTLQAATDVKKGKKWSTFLVKPEKPVPVPKKKVEEPPAKSESYKVVIKKQPRRPFQAKKVQFDQNVTELEVDWTGEAAQDEERNSDQDEEEVAEEVNEEETPAAETETNDYDLEDEESGRTNQDSLEPDLELDEDPKSEEQVEIPPSLEEQLLSVQKQLQALSQLPSAIQLTLDAVSKQLASIVGARESAERNEESASNSKDEESPQTEEEFLEDTSASEKAEAEVMREDSEANSSIAEELEEDERKQEEDMEEAKEEEEEHEPIPELTEEEKEEQTRKEELEAKRRKTMDERVPRPIQRPIILPGGRRWSNPEDAIPSFRKPKMSDEKIIETIENNLEVIIGKRKGGCGVSFSLYLFRESNCWKVPSKAVAAKRINFLKYQPPPKNLDYLQRSEVYRLVHDMEPPVLRGIVSRAEKVPAVQDYYEATKGAPEL
ncbi:hypothetical protein NQ315_017069 [Exocentrus adspersus]|uniref:PDZ domain-containing protein n=1 Tax=Exocentrus adspersus TaxID=1586481 RepID=A0AAV8VH44_9CUCU|nr:hypothetical protein NQ315_017069 [Exocentrus adspersus]